MKFRSSLAGRVKGCGRGRRLVLKIDNVEDLRIKSGSLLHSAGPVS